MPTWISFTRGYLKGNGQSLASQTEPEADMLRQSLYDALDQYIYNELPYRLIYIPKMKIVTRGEARAILWPEIQAIAHEEIKALFQIETIRTQAQSLRQFIRERVKYAALSHRWFDDAEEPTFQNFSLRETRALAGYKKLAKFCEKARKDYGCVLAWADTCCIDKTSSSELDEAIRSMFRWYSNSLVCIAYLEDSSTLADFEDEVWFTRGWTLQELLAPTILKFYGKGWLPISNSPNDKTDASVMSMVSRVTKIPRDDLATYIPGTQRAREKMRWASTRRTTRIEDIAYSLIGIFDVGITVAYGEGARAFYRLMVEIVQNCYEWDIFLFDGAISAYHFTLPESPRAYHDLPSSWTQLNKTQPRGNKWFTLSKRGLHLRLLLVDIDPIPHTISGNWVASIAVNSTPSHPDTFDHALARITVAAVRVTELGPDVYHYAIGIVDFERSAHEGEGQLLRGRDYFCFLTRRRAGYESWEAVETVDPTIVRCRQDLHNQQISTVIATERW
ncbi:hypothetical protein HYDPIDRAFT_29196 [Hydnomerulius pinastri MD-312]|uniref:Heterokaryon incompatibility domain-containing protein n=1 Tax=Hydnomerulius pinastri MD-312 TaxID=994086 RepID=A0A0C9WED4_9AGAM|nr:hypothetical protein HYDPIDRAFT_29196 [Hydnomerulius pinastri MD-312]